MGVLVSVTAFGTPPLAGVLPEDWKLVPRAGDYGLSAWHRRRVHVVDGLALARSARHADAVIVCTSNIELLVLGGLSRLGFFSCPLIAYDPLPPRSRSFDRLVDLLLSGVDAVAAIRSREMTTLPRRFPALTGKVQFVPFPAGEPVPGEPSDEGFFYAAGAAHRDWKLAFAAFGRVDAQFLVAAHGPFPTRVPDNVRLLGSLPDEAGRSYLRRARAVVVPFIDTDLPHGPLLILDALRHGKPVVATRTPGSEDYLTPECGVLVEPGDVGGFVTALTELASNPGRARAMGDAGRLRAGAFAPRTVTGQLTAMLAAIDGRAG